MAEAGPAATARSRMALALGVGLALATAGSLQTCFSSPSDLGPLRKGHEVEVSYRTEAKLVEAASAAQTGTMQVPGVPRAAAWVAAAVLAGAACAASRGVSHVSMQAKHDKKTFRGKLHAHSFGKYRLRKNKARRIQAIKNGTYDPDTTVQNGQPEPEHSWDYDNLVENPIYYCPDYLKEVMSDYWDDVNEAMRKKWKEYMGVKGNQRYFKNWTPPEVQTP